MVDLLLHDSQILRVCVEQFADSFDSCNTAISSCDEQKEFRLEIEVFVPVFKYRDSVLWVFCIRVEAILVHL